MTMTTTELNESCVQEISIARQSLGKCTNLVTMYCRLKKAL